MLFVIGTGLHLDAIPVLVVITSLSLSVLAVGCSIWLILKDALLLLGNGN